jgi:hypothetical protein
MSVIITEKIVAVDNFLHCEQNTLFSLVKRLSNLVKVAITKKNFLIQNKNVAVYIGKRITMNVYKKNVIT